ncbi:MAG: flavin reductase family protein [Burkholderiales bacterium]|nr:flavin reductase family protein [Burkholderiales bacterium]
MSKPAAEEAEQESAAAQFKRGMRSLAGAVCIVTSSSNGRRHGMTATAVCSATAEPPTVLACINRATATHRAVREAGLFCINVLRHEDQALSMLFSGGPRAEERFRPGQWTTLATGAPVLVDALVSFDCRLVNSLDHGTHTIFLGEVERLQIGRKGKPLLYSDGQYAKLASPAHGEPLPEELDYWGE